MSDGECPECADRAEIGELVHRYCDALCRRNEEAWVATWTEDGNWDIGRGAVVGREDLRGAFRKIMELFDHVIQLTHNGEIELHGDHGRGRWYVTEYGTTAKGQRVFYIAHYDDEYRRTSAGWRFSRRVGTWHYHGDPDLTGEFGAPAGYTTQG